MLWNNKELRRGALVLALTCLCVTALGFGYDPVCGGLILVACIVVLTVYFFTEHYRYRRLRELSEGLDSLLTQGITLTIESYEEGELSILAGQIEKITLRLREAAQALRKEKSLLADSMADISHQLRTPLTAMNLTASMLRSPELTAEERLRLTAELSSLLHRTDWLVETLLKLSRLDAGTVTLSAKEVPVRQLLNRAAAPLLIPMELRSQQLKLICGDEQITADPTWTAEAIGNILKNAMEHTPEGGCVTVRFRETPLFTQLTIEDTGPGFDAQDIPHLFERFYRGAHAKEGSCGIGLALARTVITAQNGTVSASNGKTGGLFTVRFYKKVI